MTLVPRELDELSGLIETLSVTEVETIYLPLSRLLNLYVAAAQELHAVTSTFLGQKERKVPFIIGVAGSVAIGKSTTARVLKALLARWPDHPRVDLITTDGFLYPNNELERRGLMDRKGFPESFDSVKLRNFLVGVKSGRQRVVAPVYSHFHYDILTDKEVVIERPDILIVEGLNVLQPARLPKDGKVIPFVSDFFDFSIYLDADMELIEHWYVERFMRLRKTAFRDPAAYFHQYALLSDEDARRKGPANLAGHQPQEPGREYSADKAAGETDLAKVSQPQDRAGGAAEAVSYEWRSDGLDYIENGRLLGSGRFLLCI